MTPQIEEIKDERLRTFCKQLDKYLTYGPLFSKKDLKKFRKVLKGWKFKSHQLGNAHDDIPF